MSKYFFWSSGCVQSFWGSTFYQILVLRWTLLIFCILVTTVIIHLSIYLSSKYFNNFRDFLAGLSRTFHRNKYLQIGYMWLVIKTLPLLKCWSHAIVSISDNLNTVYIFAILLTRDWIMSNLLRILTCLLILQWIHVLKRRLFIQKRRNVTVLSWAKWSRTHDYSNTNTGCDSFSFGKHD